MPDIKFNCPDCDQHLEAPDDMGGEQIECPSCGWTITVPGVGPRKRLGLKIPARSSGTACPKCGVALATGDVLCVQCGYDRRTGTTVAPSPSPDFSTPHNGSTIRCPFCAEPILAEARKCKHCGEWLDGGPRSSLGRPGRCSETLGHLMVAVPIVMSVAAFIWVMNLTPADRPRLIMHLMAGAMVIITAFLALAEASNLGMGQARDRHDHGPVIWLVLFLGIWGIALPAYLKRRSQYGMKNLLVGGVLAVAVFLGAYLTLGVLIHVAEAESTGRTAAGVVDSKTKSQLAELSTALEQYCLVENEIEYPSSLMSLVENPGVADWNGPYVEDSKLRDRWGREIEYVRSGSRFALRSLGPDGVASSDDIVVTGP
jgi:DNA-directed RNA polymerase subunit RPC12/RpoP